MADTFCYCVRRTDLKDNPLERRFLGSRYLIFVYGICFHSGMGWVTCHDLSSPSRGIRSCRAMEKGISLSEAMKKGIDKDGVWPHYYCLGLNSKLFKITQVADRMPRKYLS